MILKDGVKVDVYTSWFRFCIDDDHDGNTSQPTTYPSAYLQNPPSQHPQPHNQSPYTPNNLPSHSSTGISTWHPTSRRTPAKRITTSKVHAAQESAYGHRIHRVQRMQQGAGGSSVVGAELGGEIECHCGAVADAADDCAVVRDVEGDVVGGDGEEGCVLGCC